MVGKSLFFFPLFSFWCHSFFLSAVNTSKLPWSSTCQVHRSCCVNFLIIFNSGFHCSNVFCTFLYSGFYGSRQIGVYIQMRWDKGCQDWGCLFTVSATILDFLCCFVIAFFFVLFACLFLFYLLCCSAAETHLSCRQFQGRDKHADDTGAAPEELPVLPPFLAAALRGRNVSRNNPALAKNHNQALKNKGWVMQYVGFVPCLRLAETEPQFPKGFHVRGHEDENKPWSIKHRALCAETETRKCHYFYCKLQILSESCHLHLSDQFFKIAATVIYHGW